MIPTLLETHQSYRDFQNDLSVSADLVRRIAGRSDLPRSLNLVELTRGAVNLHRQHIDYELVIRPEVKHQEEVWNNGQGIDPGWTDSVEVLDDPGSVELRPVSMS